MAIKHLDKNLNRSQQENQQSNSAIYSRATAININAIDISTNNGSSGLPSPGTLLGMSQNWWAGITCGTGQQNYMQIGLSFDGKFHR